jgi:hypothetical protein
MFGRAGTHQLAVAGRLKMGSSPIGAMVSSVMVRVRLPRPSHRSVPAGWLLSRGNQNENRVNQDENAAGGVMAGLGPSGVTIGGAIP